MIPVAFDYQKVNRYEAIAVYPMVTVILAGGIVYCPL
jgi:hypothetical protein